jgi:serine/threonine protein kinase
MSMLSTPVNRGVEEIGPYQILEDLGPAPCGSLYLAVDTRSDRKTMLKVIPPSRPGALQEGASWEILLAETRSLFRIYHRGIPTLYELADLEGSLLVAFAPSEGPTLHDLLASGERPDRARLIDWGCQLLAILGEAHAEGLVHRHVSEDQIVVTPQGQLVLTGFGLTQLFFETLTPSPPEPLLSEPFLPQADLYAVGVLLRRLAFLSGLKGVGVSGLGRDPLLKVLARAAFPDPATGFQNAAEMAEALRLAGGLDAPAEAGGDPAPPVQRKARIRAVPSISPSATVSSLPVLPASTPAPSEKEDRRFALLLVAAALLLMLTVIATGWFLIGHAGATGTHPAPAAVGTSSNLPNPAVR